MILPGAEPFLLPGGPHGVLLVHGFTGSPSEMRLLGRYLQQQGYTVLGIRLMGHGTTPEDLAHTNAADWFHSVLDGYELLRGSCGRISSAGLSMGALLAMLLGTVRELDSTISFSAPIFLREADNLSLLPPKPAAAGQYLPRLRKLLPGIPADCNVCYNRMPLVSIHELLAVIEELKQALPKLRQPLLVVQSKRDHTVLAESGTYIYEHAGAVRKELFWLAESGHRVTIDSERELVFAKTAEFLAK